MRGTLGAAPFRFGWPRFIPAHAGNTRQISCSTLTAPVHPRACGEHGPNERQFRACRGSSPRMRGTRGKPVINHVTGRFIPAHAGNTPPFPRPWKAMTVHPRACGEHAPTHSPWMRSAGSSPRMRGTRYSSISPRAPSPVHPRACGEHPAAVRPFDPILGSSPRMRGTPTRR